MLKKITHMPTILYRSSLVKFKQKKLVRLTQGINKGKAKLEGGDYSQKCDNVKSVKLC